MSATNGKRLRRWTCVLVGIALLVGTITCVNGGPQKKYSPALPGDKFDPPAQVPAGALGMASCGLTPRNLPHSKPADIEDAFQLAASVPQAVSLQFQWSDANYPKLARTLMQEARRHGLMPVVTLAATTLDKQRKELDLPRSLRGKKSFGDKAVKDGWVKSAQELAQLKPPYLCLASEINYLGFQRPDEFARFVAGYKEAYRAVKAISPDTKVFPSYQYDWIRILDNVEPGKLAEHVKLVDDFRPEVDLVGITSYPYEYYQKPEDMPSNYYSYFRNYLKPGDEVMVLEIGWPGRKDLDSQERFIRRLPALLADLSPIMTSWALLHDVKLSIISDDLGSVGLLTREGRAKPALQAWREVAGNKRQ
jgi:hypothetical protein